MQTTTIWFTKSRRAQTTDDYETWIEGGVSPTLNIFDNNGDTRATVLILFEANRRDGIRLHDHISPTLQAYIGTGGNNMPMIADCYSIREDATANNFSATPIETTPALQALRPSVQSHHAQTFIAQEIPVNEPLAIDGYNQTLNKTMQTIRADKSDGDHVGMIMNETVVRRLTPIECERLQGFPDDWTAQRIDHKTGNVIEQKDSARYKQMGNAVAVPCVQWLLGRIINALRTE